MDIRYSKRLWLNLPEKSYCIDIDEKLNVDLAYYKELHRLLKIASVPGAAFVRIGNAHDGGYVMLDDDRTPQGSRIAYSFGINDDISWDDGMAERGYHVYMYDPTIQDLSKHRKEFHFSRKGIAGSRSEDGTLDTLEHILLVNRHLGKQNMILKMDVEGYEWEFLESVDEMLLGKFDQILLELHAIVLADTQENKRRKLMALEKLNRTHQLIHLHGNNCDSALYFGEACFPNALEATYVNRSVYRTAENPEIVLPHVLDAPNSVNNEEICLGKWNMMLIG